MIKIFNLSNIYTLITIITYLLGIWIPLFLLISGLLTIFGFLIILIKIYENRIDLFFYRTLEDFRKSPKGELPVKWKIQYPEIVVDKDEDAIKSEVKTTNDHLEFKTWKESVGIEDEHAWEGTEIISRENGFNGVLAKLMLNFEESKSNYANIYIKGTGRTDRYEYYLGIGSSGPDVFFHIIDLESQESVYEERGRLHLKDYLKEDIDWLFLGMEWGLSGPKIFVFQEGEKNYNKIPMNPPPKVRDNILEDSREIDLFGLKKLAIRTDLKVDRNEGIGRVTGKVQLLKAKFGYLSFLS